MILGLHPAASGEAALVRLGWLPLDYLLALHDLKYYLRCYHGRFGPDLYSRARRRADPSRYPDMLRQTCLSRNPRIEIFFFEKSKNVMIQEQDLLKAFSLGVQRSPMSFGVSSGCKHTLKPSLLPEKIEKTSNYIIQGKK